MKVGIEIEAVVSMDGVPCTLPDIEYTKESALDYEGHLMHKDGALFEMALAPAESPAMLRSFAAKAWAKAQEMVGTRTLSLRAATEYSDEALSQDKYASEIGCTPSYNVWGGKETPSTYSDNFRFGGIHVNFECDNTNASLIAYLDATLGLHSVAYWEEEFADQIRRRREFYGRAGEYRAKPFGLEYRTLPACIWTEERVELIWKMVEDASSFDVEKTGWSQAQIDDIPRIINEVDVVAARSMLNGHQ